jgi:hypothetical protein
MVQSCHSYYVCSISRKFGSTNGYSLQLCYELPVHYSVKADIAFGFMNVGQSFDMDARRDLLQLFFLSFVIWIVTGETKS